MVTFNLYKGSCLGLSREQCVRELTGRSQVRVGYFNYAKTTTITGLGIN